MASIRTLLQTNGGRLGETGSTSHLFYNCGVLQIENKNFNNDAAFELAIHSGAKECESYDKHHEIICEMKDFYKVKNNIEKKISNFMYSGIEWRPYSIIELSEDQKKKVLQMLENLDEIDYVQNIFINCNI